MEVLHRVVGPVATNVWVLGDETSREAIAIGAGGSGGGAHTLQEWFDCDGRGLGLRRILLTMLALSGVGE